MGGRPVGPNLRRKTRPAVQNIYPEVGDYFPPKHRSELKVLNEESKTPHLCSRFEIKDESVRTLRRPTQITASDSVLDAGAVQNTRIVL